MDRSFNIVYANEAAWSTDQTVKTNRPHAKCYEAFAHRTDPCGTCPAIKVFEAPGVECVSCASGGDGTACGMQQAFPLTSSLGEVGSMLILFKSEQVPMMSDVKSAEAEQHPPSAVRESLGDLIGRSPAMQQLFDMTSLVADSSATVLIQG